MTKLVEQIKAIQNQTLKDDIKMILSGCADFGSADGALISAKQFDIVADKLIEFFDLDE